MKLNTDAIIGFLQDFYIVKLYLYVAPKTDLLIFKKLLNLAAKFSLRCKPLPSKNPTANWK